MSSYLSPQFKHMLFYIFTCARLLTWGIEKQDNIFIQMDLYNFG